MRTLLLASVLIATACKKDNGDDDTDPPDTDPATVVDTDPPWGDEDGSLALIRTYAGEELERAELVAFFADSDQGFVNAAACALDEDVPCLSELPSTAGSFIEYDPTQRFTPSSSFYRYVGLSVPFGPYEAFYDVEEEWSYYYADLTEEDPFEGPAGITLGVEWGPFETAQAAVVPGPLVAMLPDAETTRAFSDDVAFPFTWEPGDGGEMYLTVRTADATEGLARVYLVEDDGEFLLDLSSLGLLGDHDLLFTLSRWTFDTLDVNGSDLTVQTTAESEFALRLFDVTGREPLDLLRDSCDDAFVGPLADGQYYGDLGEFTDDTQQAACLQSFDAANGRDGIADVVVPPRSRIQVSYRQLDANASMYLLDSCDAPPVCLLGADEDTGLGLESFSLFNASATETLEHVLVLDAADPLTGDLFFFELETIDVPDPGLVDTCVEALAEDPIEPGVYYSDSMTGLFPNLDPGFTGCTGTSLSGPDGLIPVSIGDGQTLEVTVNMPGSDPAIYLLQNCQDTGTCFAGSDITGETDALVYTNTSGGAQQGYLVLDTDDATGGAYTLTVSLQ